MINENLSLWYQSWYEEQANKGQSNKISYYYLEDYCSEIKLNMSVDKIVGTLTFKIPYGIYSPSIFPINIRKGDKVSLKYKNLILFTGKVIAADKNSNQEMEVTCYDYCWFLCKSKISKNFSNITVYDAIKWVYNNVGMYFNAERFKSELGENANIMLDTHLIEEKEASKVLSAIYTDVRNKTGLSYYMHTAGYSSTQDVIITETDRYYSGLTLEYSSKDKADGNVIDWSISESMENMITQYRIYGENAEPVRVDRGNNDTSFNEDDSDTEKETSNIIRLNEGDYLHYGVLQDIITMKEEDDIEKVRQKALNNMTKNNGEPILNVTCFGDLDYCPAYGVHVKIPCTEFYDKFAYINTSEFIWNKDGSFISKLQCKLSKHTDMTEWDEIEAKATYEDATGEGGSGSVENAVQWAISIANDDTHGYSMPRRWSGVDYDCSSLVISAFEQAGIPLKTNGATYTGDMKAVALKCGFELVNWNHDMNNLKRGDILLNEARHTEIYIGGGKDVGAHSDYDGVLGDSSGKEVSISNYHDYPWDCVLRYPEQDTSSVTDGSLNDAVNATSQKEFAEKVSSYAKELYKKYHIFAGVQIACMIQESWTGNGFTKLAKNDYNLGGVKTSDPNKGATDYKPPASEGSMLYRKFNGLKEYMVYWCQLISGQTGMSVYKTNIADKSTPKEQIFGFSNTPYAGDSSKSTQMWSIYNSLGLSKYDN